MVLGAEQLLPRVRPGTLVIGLFEETLARTCYSSFGTSKPSYTLDDGQLVFHAPRRAEPDVLLSGWRGWVRDALGGSAVLDVVQSRLAPGYWHGAAGEDVYQSDGSPWTSHVRCWSVSPSAPRDPECGCSFSCNTHARPSSPGRGPTPEDMKEVATCAAPAGIEVIDQFEVLRSLTVANPGALNNLYLQFSATNR